MRINFFDWVREGVRQSILLGLSDAADEIGSEKDVEVLNQQLLSSLDQGRIVDETAKTSRGRRKALGAVAEPNRRGAIAPATAGATSSTHSLGRVPRLHRTAWLCLRIGGSAAGVGNSVRRSTESRPSAGEVSRESCRPTACAAGSTYS